MAVCRGVTILGEVALYNPRSHSERLLPSVETLLEMTGLAPTDLGAVAVSIGPGSFTGLRIGVAAAKGLAFGLGIPLFGIPTLEVLAANAPPVPKQVCAVIDARRGEIFTALFQVRDEGLFKVREESILSADRLAESLPSGTLIVGNADFPAGDAPSGRAGKRLHRAPPQLNFPRASVVALRGASMAGEGLPSSGESLVPLYLRPSDAEANRARKAGGPLPEASPKGHA